MSGIPYRRDQDPPYPALRIELSCSGDTHVCDATIDTGASRTCVPAQVLNEIGAVKGLPALLSGYDGEVTATWTYYVSIEIVDSNWPEDARKQLDSVEVCAIEDPEDGPFTEVLIGRDLLRNWALLLEGPRDMLHVQT